MPAAALNSGETHAFATRQTINGKLALVTQFQTSSTPGQSLSPLNLECQGRNLELFRPSSARYPPLAEASCPICCYASKGHNGHNRSFPGTENPADAGFLNEYNRPVKDLPDVPGKVADAAILAVLVMHSVLSSTANSVDEVGNLMRQSFCLN